MMKRLSILFVFAFAACSEEPDPPPIQQPPPPVVEDPLELTAAAPPPNGPALWLEGAISGDHIELDVRGRELGEIVAWALTLKHDDQLLETSGVAIDETVLGADARHMLRQENAAWVAGGVRTPLTAVTISEAVKLLHFTVKPRKNGTSAITIERATARRADGGYVAIAVAGATVIARGGAQ